MRTISLALGCMLASTLTTSSKPADRPNFAGTWRLVAQETSAFHGRGAIGNYEEPVCIDQTPPRLTIAVQSADPAGRFEYDLSGDTVRSTGPNGEELTATSQWKGTDLVTTGRRLFTSPTGAEAYDFKETRHLSAGDKKMIVELRIKMFPRDLVRTSVYQRVEQ